MLSETSAWANLERAEITEDWGKEESILFWLGFGNFNLLGFEELPTRTFSALWKYSHTQNLLWQKAEGFKSQWFLLTFSPLCELYKIHMLHGMSDFYYIGSVLSWNMTL